MILGLLVNYLFAILFAGLAQSGSRDDRDVLRNWGNDRVQTDPLLHVWWAAERTTDISAPEGFWRRSWPCAQVQLVSGRGEDGERLVLQSVEAGWPWRSFSGSRWVRLDPNDSALPRPSFQFRVIPWIPVPTGFLLNMVVFLGLPLLAVQGFHWINDWERVARARREERRGCCPYCGYNLLGKFWEGCPECGWLRERS